jgi:hypothetical protein
MKTSHLQTKYIPMTPMTSIGQSYYVASVVSQLTSFFSKILDLGHLLQSYYVISVVSGERLTTLTTHPLGCSKCSRSVAHQIWGNAPC